MSDGKKILTERDRARIRAQKLSKAVSSQKNVDTQTNLTYLKFKKEFAGESADQTSTPTQKFDPIKELPNEDGDSPNEQGDPDEQLSGEEGAIIQKDEDSTGASEDSDESDTGDIDNNFDPRDFLFLGSGDFIKQWNNFVILMAMYNSITIPLQIFYKEKSHSALQGSTVKAIDSFVDLFFLIDIIIKFRTTFLDSKESIEVRNPHVIGKKYLKGGFTVDLISSVPWSSFLSESSQSGIVGDLLDALGLLKLLRLSRLYSTVQRSNLEKNIKVYLKVVMMAIFLIVFMHVLSCIWFLVVSAKERWVQNMDFMYAAQPDAYQGFFEGDDAFWQKYLVLLYTGFYLFGVGEVVPRQGPTEFFAAFILCSLNTIFNAVIIGYMTAYMEQLSQDSQMLNASLNQANTAMINLKLSGGLKQQITQYIYQTYTTKKLQNEFTDFINQISPVYQRKVTKESFKQIVRSNVVLFQVKNMQMEYRAKIVQRNLRGVPFRNAMNKEEDKIVTLLVVKLESVFTSPDICYLQQEDEANYNPNLTSSEQVTLDDDGNQVSESFMYFIKKGKFSVHVKEDWVSPKIMDDTDKPAPVAVLIDGDHFGEIGMLFDCKRTTSIISENYGNLALLKKSSFLELSKAFEMFPSLLRKQTFKYDDHLTFWLNFEMSKISYFNNLSLQTKQEIIYAMDRYTFVAGDIICRQDEKADKLFLIQSGIIEIKSPYDRRREGEYFVMERLGPGSIINHRSFVIRDEADTDFVCKTTVSAFVLTFEKLRDIAAKRQDLQREKENLKQVLYAPLYPLALDYIFHCNISHDQNEYQQNLRSNELKVKFKNAIMQYWTKIKEDSQPGNLQKMIDDMLKAKNDSKKEGVDYAQQKKMKEELEKKRQKHSERLQQKKRQLEDDAKNSYLNIEQFGFLNKNIEMANKRLKEQQDFIDTMETKMISKLEQRHNKENNIDEIPDKQ